MVILVRGLGGGIQLDFLKATFQKAAKGTFNSVTNSLSLFAYLVGTAGNSQSDAGSVYQAILILVISLATIWALRQVIAGTKVRIRDTFYRGMYPLIPFILVLVVIALQLLPLIIGNWFFHIVMANSIAVTLLEKFLWGLLFALLALLSIYMVCSSVFALYIVTLPDMTPLKALRSARQLVLHRRWSVIRKVLFLPIILIIISAIIMVPLILWLTPAAQWVFFGLTMVTLVVVHSYMYTLYRELL